MLSENGLPTINGRHSASNRFGLLRHRQESWPKGQPKNGNGTCTKQSCGYLEQNATRQKRLSSSRRGRNAFAIVLDKLLSEAQALVETSMPLCLKLRNHQNKHAHPIIAQMLHPDVRDDLPPSECVPAPIGSQSSHIETTNRALPPTLPSMWDTGIGTSEVFRLIRGRLHCHVSGKVNLFWPVLPLLGKKAGH